MNLNEIISGIFDQDETTLSKVANRLQIFTALANTVELSNDDLMKALDQQTNDYLKIVSNDIKEIKKDMKNIKKDINDIVKILKEEAGGTNADRSN